MLPCLYYLDHSKKVHICHKQFEQFCPRIYVAPLRRQVSYVFGHIDDFVV